MTGTTVALRPLARAAAALAACAAVWAAVAWPAGGGSARAGPAGGGGDGPTAEWTIMVFLNADNDLEKDGVNDFLEMAKVGSTDKVNVVVQFDRHPGFDNRFGNWAQTLRFKVEKGMDPTADKAVADLGEVDMGSGKELAAFVTWAREKYPAKRYMLDVWDHGQGWRFQLATTPPLADTPEGKQRLTALRAELLKAAGLSDNWRKERRRPPGNPKDYWMQDEAAPRPLLADDQVIPGTHRYISIDMTNKSKMFNRDIQDSLQGALGKDKLAVIGFDACLMSMIETAYAVRKVAEVMVGSEELEPGAGWNYTLWLADLTATPAAGPADLGKMLVQAYEKHYVMRDPETTLSAIDLAHMDGLAQGVSGLADACKGKLGTHLDGIRKARMGCANYAPGEGLHGIDLGRLCEQLAESAGDDAIKTAALGVRGQVGKVVIANYAGADRKGAFGSTGVAIYFPSSKTDYETDPDKVGYTKANANFPVEFVQTQTWVDFLHEYFAKVP